MNNNYYALLIGINSYPDMPSLQYAEKDATDLFSTLTDKKSGLFPKKNVRTIIGPQATWQNIQKGLLQFVVEREPLDTVLFFYAGHTVDIDGKVFILSSDLSRTELRSNILSYTSMSLQALRNNIFDESKAKNIVLVLDTCHSGAIFSQERGKDEPLQIQNLQTRILDAFPAKRLTVHDKHRSIIVSSPPTLPSLEDRGLQNGAFTHCILEGLRGGTPKMKTFDSTGEVTVDVLINYVKKHPVLERFNQQPGGYSVGYGHVALTKPGPVRTTEIEDTAKIFSLSEIKKITTFPELSNFGSPLDEYLPIMDKILDYLKSLSHYEENLEDDLLHAICQGIKANHTLLLVKKDKQWKLRAIRSKSGSQSAFTGEHIAQMLGAVEAAGDIFSSGMTGHKGKMKVADQDLIFLAISLGFFDEQKLLVVFGDAQACTCFATDDFAHFMQGLFRGLALSQEINLPLIEGYWLDYLKTYYPFVPQQIYTRRHDLFTERLGQMSVRFQPIIDFSTGTPFISGYEALASDPENLTTPVDLFSAAELWGDHFKIHLDAYFFDKAVKTYCEKLSAVRRRRQEDVLDLSVNVYPETLMRSAYYKAVSDVIDEQLLPCGKLHLEISEKSPLPTVFTPGDGIVTEKITSFRDVLFEYVNNLGISFALDDFGVGHSSVSRLAVLTPRYIKIDREILLADTASETLEFIIGYAHNIVTRRVLSKVKIVVEGFEETPDIKITLPELLKLGVDHVQGYIIGKPSEDLIRLTQEQLTFLNSLMER